MTTFRTTPQPSDRGTVRRLVAETGVFSDIEVGWAVEIVDAALDRGCTATGYHFLFADNGGELEGFACFGPIDGTANRFDLYWIAVSPTAAPKVCVGPVDGPAVISPPVSEPKSSSARICCCVRGGFERMRSFSRERGWTVPT